MLSEIQLNGKVTWKRQTYLVPMDTQTRGECQTSKLYLSLEAAMALSRFFLPTKHHGQTVSELTSILTSFFSEVPLMILLYLQYPYNIESEHKVKLLWQGGTIILNYCHKKNINHHCSFIFLPNASREFYFYLLNYDPDHSKDCFFLGNMINKILNRR